MIVNAIITENIRLKKFQFKTRYSFIYCQENESRFFERNVDAQNYLDSLLYFGWKTDSNWTKKHGNSVPRIMSLEINWMVTSFRLLHCVMLQIISKGYWLSYSTTSVNHVFETNWTIKREEYVLCWWYKLIYKFSIPYYPINPLYFPM